MVHNCVHKSPPLFVIMSQINPVHGLGVGLTILPCKKGDVEKPPRNQPDFVEKAKVLSCAVEPRKEEE
jgi:hypothetical protein